MDAGHIIGIIIFGSIIVAFVVALIKDVRHNRRVENNAWFTYEGERFNQYKTDKATGLPLLPDGWFWQVSDATEDDGDHQFSVKLMRVGDKNMDHGEVVMYRNSYYKVKVQIQNMAYTVLKNLHDDNVKYVNPYTYLFGNYPPKSL